MASEVAHPEAIKSTLPGDAHLTNGDHNESRSTQDNLSTFEENATISKSEPTINSSGPVPVESVAPGITPVADFIPKDAPTSHPTPPPDEPLATSDVIVDAEMTTDADAESTKVESRSDLNHVPEPAAPALSSTESSLVRPREEYGEDEEEEPAAKRSRVEADSSLGATIADVPAVDASVTPSPDALVAAAVEPATDVPSEPVSEVVVATTTDVPTEPRTAEELVVPAPAPESDAASEKPVVESVKQEVSNSDQTQPAASQTPSQTTSISTQPPQPAASSSQSLGGPPKPSYSKAPLTQTQVRFLQEKTKNLKKTKNSVAFLAPVDPVALGIPQYFDIIKNPMDLGTMETKLKAGKYSSVQDYAEDFYLIIGNARRFNGDAHSVTQAGFSMEAYFRKMMESVPSADQPAAPKPLPKKASPKPQSHTQRRESRSATQATVPAPPTPTASSNATAGGEAFALQPDGTPQIRRDSTINRPARTIKPPPARELTYSKPKRKEHQLELKFCEFVLGEVRGPKFAQLNHVFQAPVDPVALNIPHYRQIVKHPMDLSTMAQKLKQGQYGKANEFKKDFELMITNCLAFNPVGNPVRDIGVQFQREFDALWKNKEKWERMRKADSQRANSASADDDSGEEEEEEEEEIPEGDQAHTIRALQKQLAEMQSALAGLGKVPKPQKKAKSTAKPATKKAAGVAAAPKQKTTSKPKAAKKPKQVTYEEKQEISEAVGKMNGSQVEELTQIITTNCKKYANQEEMELEIDDLPNDVQAMLLKYVRSIFGNPNRGARAVSPDDVAAFDDDDFEPERGGRKSGGASKRKKHKPMGKKEQQEAINNLQKQLSQFQGGGTSASQSPSSYAVQDDTSGDEESEESEEE